MTEDAFLQALFAQLPPPGDRLVVPVGDDCAAIRVSPGKLLLVAVDQLIGEKHYRLQGADAATPEQAGRKLLARNLSDIAAMGGVPRYCLVAAALDPLHDTQWLRRFFDGLLALAADFGVELVGGDLATTPTDSVASLTILGDVSAANVCRRSGAQAGDLLFATGCFGSSLPTQHHLLFSPRCREGAWLARKRFAAAMIDVSDGLLLDGLRLCRASGLGAEIAPDRVPRRTPHTSWQDALGDGEDYELLFAVRPGNAEALIEQWPFPETPLTCIGTCVEASPPEVRDETGKPLWFQGGCGYDHFAQ